MDFLITTCEISSIDKLKTECFNQIDKKFQMHTLDHLKIFLNDDFDINDKPPLLFFDGHMSYEAHFYHYLRDNAGLSGDIRKILRKGTKGINGGIYCLGELKNGEIHLTIDELGQYPLYWYDNEFMALSNNFQLMLAILDQHCTKRTKSLYPCIENIIFGGVIGDKTHVKEIRRVPFGCSVTIGETFKFIEQPNNGQPLTYNAAITNSRRAVSRYIKSVHVGPDDNIITDITGGGDSRCMLSFLLNSSLPITGRCITSYPNPDANVAGYIMKQFDIPVGTMPIVDVNCNGVELGVRQNALLFGGARDPVPFVSPIAFNHLVHFRGSFGELGGATPGSDYISQTFTLDGAVDLCLKRRKMAKALDLVTDDAKQYVRHEMLKLFDRLSWTTPKGHLLAESYLRTRCRTHFGLNSFILNKTKIIPDPFANKYLIQARRKLPAKLHTVNKVIFDLTVMNNKKLTFIPMAGKAWSKKLTKHQAPVVKPDTAPLHDYSGALFNPKKYYHANGYKSMTNGNCRVKDSSKFAAQRNMRTYQELLKLSLENISPNHDMWQFFNRQRVEEYAFNDNIDKSIAISAMGRVASGILWMVDLGLPVHVYERMK